MGGFEERVARLRAEAADGDTDAARELGRLLSMLSKDIDEQDDEEVQSWPEERWLRAAVQARPDDGPAALLLAGRLVQQIAHWGIDPDHAEEHGEDEETRERREDEAKALYTRVLEADPENPVARAGLAALAAWAHGEGVEALELKAPFSYYSLEMESGSGSFSHTQTVVTTGLDEARWACAQLVAPLWTEVGEVPLGIDLHLFVIIAGETHEVVRLDDRIDREGRIDWDAVPVPPLTGEPLPPGHPAGTDHYGYSCDWG